MIDQQNVIFPGSPMLSKLNFCKSPVGITLLFITLILLFSDYQFRLKDEKWKTAINSDAYDYYRYLPMVFINHDFDLRKTDEGKTIPIKHYVGTAIFFFPFFCLAVAGSILMGFPVDGISMLFQVSITLGTLFYLLLGLFFFSNFLRFYKIPEWIICLLLVIIISATNVFYYTVIAPGWSHIIAFFLISMILFHVKKIYQQFNKSSLFIIISGFSFLFFTRPTDILLALFIPFFAIDKNQLITTLKLAKTEIKTIIISISIALVPLAIQLATYKMQTGHWIIWSYANEGKFNFLKPEIFKVLFSYAKGLFIYTPICLICLGGLIPLYRINKNEFFGLVIFLILSTYIISSWWCWNYGYCYGQRAFIDIYPLFFLLLGLLINFIKSRVTRYALLFVFILLTVQNCLQIYQCEKGVLDMDFRTDKKGFWSVFLKTSGYSGKYYRFPVDTSSENLIKTTGWFNDMEKIDTSWISPNTLVKGFAHSGNYASRVNKDNSYSCGIIKKMKDVPYHRNVLIRVSGWFYIPPECIGSYFAISFSNNWQSFNFNPFGLPAYIETYNKWQYLTFEMYMPKLRINKAIEANDNIEFYLFNNAEQYCYVDDLKIEFIEFKKLDRILDIWWD